MGHGVQGSIWDVSPASIISFAPCYCEENVFKLIEFLEARRKPGPLSLFAALFMTSRSGVTPVWRQRVGRGREGLALWDYHVLALELRADGRLWAWDVDRWAGGASGFGMSHSCT